MIEKDIEDYLCDKVKAAGGEVRKVEWVGRKHAPDRRVMLPGRCCFVECKRPGAKARPGQLREHDRMRALGELVFVVSTFDEVDDLFKCL
jgi:hypothetical protein